MNPICDRLKLNAILLELDYEHVPSIRMWSRVMRMNIKIIRGAAASKERWDPTPIDHLPLQIAMQTACSSLPGLGASANLKLNRQRAAAAV